MTLHFFYNYADDNKLFIIGKDINKVKDILAKDFVIVTNLFHENFMVLNSKKCHSKYTGRDEGKMKHLLLKMFVIKTARKKLF